MHEAAVSPDGRWLAYITVELGASQLYVTDLQGEGGSLRVSSDPATKLLWAPSGDELLYRSEGWLFSNTLELEPEVRVIGTERLFNLGTYSMYGDDIGSLDRSGERLLLRKPSGRDVNPLIVKGWAPTR